MNWKSAAACLLLLPSLGQANDVIEKHFRWLGDESPGCGVGVVQGKDLVYEGYFGQASLRFDVPVKHDTRFNIGSISKHMTAALILSLEREGKLSRQDSLLKYYPDGPAWFDSVTLDHMIHHTSGLGDYLNNDQSALVKAAQEELNVIQLAGGRALPLDFAQAPLIEYLKALPRPGNEPGKYHQYSNTGYVLLAMIAEQVTNTSFPELMQQHVFGPLQMTQTQVLQPEAPETLGYAQGYDWNQARPPRFTPVYPMLGTVGDGGVISTIGDMAKWVANLLQPAEKVAHWSAMYRPELIETKQLPATYGAYNINGLFYVDAGAYSHFGHDGYSVDGQMSHFVFSQPRQLAYIQLCNFNSSLGPEIEDVLTAFAANATK